MLRSAGKRGLGVSCFLSVALGGDPLERGLTGNAAVQMLGQHNEVTNPAARDATAVTGRLKCAALGGVGKG